MNVHNSSANHPHDETAAKPGLTPRAWRFPIKTFIHFRQNGNTRWIGGITVNLSYSGVLFHTLEFLEARTNIEMLIVSPLALIVCWGVVARTETAISPVSGSIVAAAILDYCLTPFDSRYRRT